MAAPLRGGGDAVRIAIFTISRHQLLVAGIQRRCIQTMIQNDAHALVQASTPLLQITRSTNFFTKATAKDLWKGVVAVSNAGKKRGRGKRVGRKRAVDLNKGQVLGDGKANMQWPGLNSPVLKGKEVIQRKQLPPNPERESEIVQLRDKMSRILHKAQPPLLRGWTGSRFPGQSIGPPDPIGDYKFEGFDTKVLEFRLVTNMTGTLGRKQRFSAMVVVGNKNGIAGYGMGKGTLGRGALRVAKNRAAQNLMYIPRFDNHTVFHDMFSQFHKSKMFIHKKERGYGLRGHRVIRTIAELMGIEDLRVKIDRGAKNTKTVARAFFQAMTHQETHQDLANRMNLHVVEFREEREGLPVVVASPEDGIVSDKPLKDEEEDLDMDFSRLYFGGCMEHKKTEKQPPWAKLKSYKKKSKEMSVMRNQPQAQILRRAGLWKS